MFRNHFLKFILTLLYILLICAAPLACSFIPGLQNSSAEDPVETSLPEKADSTESNSPSENSNDVEINDPAELHIPYIGIYSGKGSWDVNVEAYKYFFDRYEYKWELFDENDAVNMDLSSRFDLILFPGGFAAEYKNLIPEHDNIRQFVENGGAFVGTCAGAYYASDILRWHGTDHDYPLNLFPGKGTGPLAGAIVWGEIASFQLTADHPANNGFEQSLDMYYFDGPYFDVYDPSSIEILASYAVNDKPAVIAGRYGSGKYLLFGPHPELGGYSPQSPDFNLEGEEGAQWPWLHSSLLWFSNW